MKQLLIIICVLMPLGLRGQTAQRLSATKANDYAVAFSLPKTMVDVTLEAKLTVKRPGEFALYAPKFLNINNPITAESHSVELLSALVYTHGEADNDERYAIQFKSGQAVYVTLSEDGIPLGINTDQLPAVETPTLPEAHKAEPTPLQTPAARAVMSQEMLESQSVAKKAELAAQYIFAIRQTRSELITGSADTTPPDGKSLQLMLDNLQAQEDALMAMFVGTVQTSTQVETFTVDPSALADDDSMRVIVARLSATEGIVDADDLSGAPVYLNLTAATRAEAPVNEKGQPLSMPKNGIPYTIPGTLTATVTYDGRTYATETLAASQLGLTYGLAPNSFTDRKAPIYILYDPATGALLRQGPAN